MIPLNKYGFEKDGYNKVIAIWDATSEAKEAAQSLGITLWYFPDIMNEIREFISEGRTYFVDDILRTLHLFDRTLKKLSD